MSTLDAVAPDLWQASALLPLPGRVRMPIRSTIARLPDGGLVVCSPIAFDDAVAAEIAALGPVRALVAPNVLHHLFLGDAIRRWPAAEVWAAPGLREKRPDLRIDRVFGVFGQSGATSGDPWPGALDALHIGGAPRISEVALFHRASGTLIATDLVFHVTRPATLSTRLLLSLVGAGRGRLAQSRVWHLATRDRGAARAAADRLLRWPITRIAVAHGEPYAAPDARAALARAMTRMTRSPLALPATAASGT